MPVLVPLVAHPSAAAGADDALSAALVALCDAATDDALLKRLNLDVLMHTRSDDARARIFALRCASALWQAHGSKLIGMFVLFPRFARLGADLIGLRFRVGDCDVHCRVCRRRV